MKKNRFDIKEKLKKLNTVPLYIKEKFIICFMIFCFASSGITLPILKERLTNTVPVPQEQSPAEDIQDETTTDDIQETTQKEETDTEPVTPNVSQENIVQEPTVKPNPSETPDPSTDNGGTPNSPDTNTSVENTPPATDQPETNDKIWVPPVYEIIHHEAITEIRTVYYCSGTINESADICNQVFDSMEAWNTHKSIHGG